MTRLLTICCLWFLIACVIALGQGCASATKGDWCFREYDAQGYPTGNTFRLEQIKPYTQTKGQNENKKNKRD